MTTPITKEWCLRMAQLEGDAEIGAGELAIGEVVMPAPITDEAIAAIKAGLAGLPPSPWYYDPYEKGGYAQPDSPASMTDECGDTVIECSWASATSIGHRTYAHIARMDPATVAGLIARIEAAEAARREAIRLMSVASREAGEWKGRYNAAGYPDTLDGLIARAEKAEARVKRLEEALGDCAEWFKGYGDSHTAKGDIDKAQRNYDRERRARAALEGE